MTGIIATIVSGNVTVGGTVSTPDLNPNAAVSGGTSSAVLSLTSAGAYSATNDLSGNYCTPTSLASVLEARLVVNSGTLPTGSALNTWLNLGTTRTWTLTASAGNLRIASCTLSIREASTGTVRDTSTVTFTADST